MLTYADVCWRMLTSARMLTHAGVCRRMLTYADGEFEDGEMSGYGRYADVC
jgi:hypothetical protein